MKRTPSQDASGAGSSAAELPILERVLFFTLLAVLGARPLISESFERVELSFLTAIGAGLGTAPSATAWLDSLALTAAAAALARSWQRWRSGMWVVLSVAFLAVAVAVSVAAAGDRRLALNAGFSLLVGVLCAAALVQLMRAPWMPRLLLAVTLAGGCATATKCIIWKVYELESTVQYWEENKSALVTEGLDPDNPTVVNFERRLRSGEAIGYQAHPNVTGSLLMMWLVAAGGLLAGWLAGYRRGPEGERAAALVMCGGVCVALAIGLWLTGSTGAIVSCVAGVFFLLALGSLRRRLARWASRVTALLVAGYLVVIAAAVGYGVDKGTLPHPSLAFRWHYWAAATETIQDAPLTGIGRLNFADAYLRHKPAAATEEVRDPHNLWLSLLVELGPLGLLAGGLLVVGCVRGALRRLDTATDDGVPVQRTTAAQVAVAAIGVLLLHALFSAGIVSWPTAFLWAVELGGVWALSLVLAVRVLDRMPASAAAWGWLTAGLAAAVLAALVHGLIDFALLTPSGLCVFVVLAACALSVRPGAQSGAAPSARAVPALMSMVLVGAHLVLVTVPTMRTGFWLTRMKSAQFDPRDPAACQAVLEWGQKALACDPLNAAAAREVAGFAAMLGSNSQIPAEMQVKLLEQARDFAQTGLVRNGRSCAAHVRLARIYGALEEAYLRAARTEDSVTALQSAVAHWQAAVDLYPTDPRTRISAGKVWFGWSEETEDAQAGRIAAGHLVAALDIDAARPPEEVQRLRPGELQETYHYLRELEKKGYGVPAASAPALP